MNYPLNDNHEGEFVTLIDYDWTLANTTESSDDLWLMIAEQSEIALEQVAADGAGFHPSHLGGYDFTKHVDSYGLDEDELWEELDYMAEVAADRNPPAYLYSDSALFMRNLIRNGLSPSILTFGEDRFQRAKINPNLDYLSDGTTYQIPVDTVMEGKGEFIARTYPNKKGVLVDDKPGQKLPDGFTEIQLDRAADLQDPKKIESGFIVADLFQAQQIIEQIKNETAQ
jgi:hypothetical protein